MSLAVYSLPPTVFDWHFVPSTPTRYTAALETQRVYPPSQQRSNTPSSLSSPSPFRPSTLGGTYHGTTTTMRSQTATPARTAGPFNVSQRLLSLSRGPSRTGSVGGEGGYGAASPAPSLGFTAPPDPHLQYHLSRLGRHHLHPAVGPLGPQPHSQMGTPTPVRALAHEAHLAFSGSHGGSHSGSGSGSMGSPAFGMAAVGRATGLGRPKGPPSSPDWHLYNGTRGAGSGSGGGGAGCISPGLTGRLLHDIPVLNASSSSNVGTPRGYGATSPVLAARGLGMSGSGAAGARAGRRAHSPVTGVAATTTAATASSAFFSSGSVQRQQYHHHHYPQPDQHQPLPPPPPPPPPAQPRWAPPTLEQLSAAVAAMAAEERREEEQQQQHLAAAAYGLPQPHRRTATGGASHHGPAPAGAAATAPPTNAIAAEEEEDAEVGEAEAGRKSATQGRESPSPLLPTSVSPLPYPSASPRPPSVLMMATTTAAAAGTTGSHHDDPCGATADRLFASSTRGRSSSRPDTSYSHLWPSHPPPASARATPFAGAVELEPAPEPEQGWEPSAAFSSGADAGGPFDSAPVGGGDDPLTSSSAMVPQPPPTPTVPAQQGSNDISDLASQQYRRPSPVPGVPPPPPPPKAPCVTFYHPSQQPLPPLPPPTAMPPPQQQPPPQYHHQAGTAASAAYSYHAADAGPPGMWGP